MAETNHTTDRADGEGEELERLSKAATQGLSTVHEGQPDDHGPEAGGGFTFCLGKTRRTGGGRVIHRFGFAEDIYRDHNPAEWAEAEATIKLLSALWNAYRSGKLIPAPSFQHSGVEGGGKDGRDPSGSGSQALPEAPSDLRPTGVDPSRGPADEPNHTICIGWPTIERVAREGAVWFDDLQAGLIAASDLYGNDISAIRPCTCHPDDNPPRPCPRRYAYSEYVEAAASSAPASGLGASPECLSRGPAVITERDAEAPIYEAFARYVGDADERAYDFRMFATGYHAAIEATNKPIARKVDSQVWAAAQHLDAMQMQQPEWLWFTYDGVEGVSATHYSFGRWPKGAQGMAPYVRADIALGVEARTTAPARGLGPEAGYPAGGWREPGNGGEA